MADTALCPHHTRTPPRDELFAQHVWTCLQQQLQAASPPLWQAEDTAAPATTLLARLVADKFCDQSISFSSLYAVFLAVLQDAPHVMVSAAQDLHAYCTQTPDHTDYITPFLHSKGFQAVQAYRLAHILWGNARHLSALHLQNRISEVTGIDIHPAAKLGHRLVLGPGGGIVIGETTLVENDVALMSDVTLGGTGKQTGKRHPTIGRGTLVGPGTQILGPIDIGEGVKIGAGAVVVKPVRAFSAVAGNPARYINSHDTWPVLTMDLSFPSIDYLI